MERNYVTVTLCIRCAGARSYRSTFPAYFSSIRKLHCPRTLLETDVQTDGWTRDRCIDPALHYRVYAGRQARYPLSAHTKFDFRSTTWMVWAVMKFVVVSFVVFFRFPHHTIRSQWERIANNATSKLAVFGPKF